MKSRTQTELDLKWVSLNKVRLHEISFSEDGKQKESLEFVHRSKRKESERRAPS